MATSRSAKRGWTAGAYVYSGRRDPTWTVRPRLAERLLKIWDSAQRWTGARPEPPPLGYRGCFLRDPEDRQWHAFGGVITVRTGGAEETRFDREREFEKRLLSSAPQGSLPPGLP